MYLTHELHKKNRIERLLPKAYAEWLDEHDWDVALTLNYRADICYLRAVDAAKHFWNAVDCEVFSWNDVFRRGIRVPRCCFIEGDDEIANWHYHMAVRVPKRYYEKNLDLNRSECVDKFCGLLTTQWGVLMESGRFTKSKPIYDKRGWLDYISKSAGEQDQALCLATSTILTETT